jgi:hypothetical protein
MGHTLVFTADFIPSHGHIQIPYVASVDMQPLLSMKEKADFLEEAEKKQYILVYQHDSIHEASYVNKTKRGFVEGRTLYIKDI